MAAYREKSGVYKVKQGGILKPALLCRDYRSSLSLTLRLIVTFRSLQIIIKPKKYNRVHLPLWSVAE